jgi:Ca-activated chloride channel family protein
MNDAGPNPNGTGPAFQILVRQHEYLSTMRPTMNAIVTVVARGLGAARSASGSGPSAAEVIVVDTSGSMSDPPEKMRAAVRATEAAVGGLRDGVHFAVVGGTHRATMIYPEQPGLVAANDATRAAATRAVHAVPAVGGTAIGAWLTLADQLLDGYSGAVRHVLMFTDGRNRQDLPKPLEEVLDACRGRFVCDARGIGDDWRPAELNRIVTALNGQSDAVRRYDDLVEDFRALMRSAMGRVVPDVDLRVRPMANTELVYVKQVYPTVAELAPRRAVDVDTAWDHRTGAWGDEQRDYHVCLTVDPTGRPMGEETVAARVELVVGDSAIALPELPGLIRVRWTTDPVLFTRSEVTVEHYLRQEELGERVRAGCAALEAGDDERAVAELGRAVALATAAGNERYLHRLAALVEIDDGAEGVVRLRRDSELADIRWNQGGSAFTELGPDGLPVPERVVADPGLPVGTCRHCGYDIFPRDAFCDECGRPADPEERTP